MALEKDLSDTARETIRVPSNLMGYIRASYDSREKMLDWMLAIGVTLALTFAFRDQIRAMLGVSGDLSPNAGRARDQVPNQNIPSAFPYAGPSGGRYPGLYAYNMPVSRRIREHAGPSATRPPANPSVPATYDKDIK